MTTDTETLTVPSLSAKPRDERYELWERERRAFSRLLGELLPQYRGQYVAIHGERVVGSGPEEVDLTARVLRDVGFRPIFVALVTDDPIPERIPHVRVVAEDAASLSR